MSEKLQTCGAEPRTRPFGLRDKFGYALGDCGCNMSFAFIQNYLLLFYVTCMKLDPAHYTVIILLGKIFDAINDPVIGGLCDASKPRKGDKFKPWIKRASLPLLLSSVLMFIYVPDAPYWVKAAMCLGLYCVWSVAYTSVNVPYGSLQAVITTDPKERAQLSLWRSLGAGLAQIPIMIGLPLLVYDKNDDPRGELFIVFVAVMGVLGLFAFRGLCRLTVVRVEPQAKQVRKFSYFATLKAFFQNRNILGVTISSVAMIALMLTQSNSMQYVFMCYYRNTKLISVGMILLNAPMALGVVFLSMALKRFTKKQLCTYPFLLSAVVSAVVTFIRFENPIVWTVLLALVHFGTGFYLVLVWALVADCIDYQEQRSGRREEGSIYATYSFFRKVAQGLGQAFISLSLKWAHYSAEAGALGQAEGVPERIYFVTGLLPLVGSVICLLSMHFLYRLDDKKQEGSK